MVPAAGFGLVRAGPRHWKPDQTLRVDPVRRTVIGGSPIRLFRLSDRGMALVERIRRQTVAAQDTHANPVELDPAELRLVERLVMAGVIHPVPDIGSGPFEPADVTVVIPVRDDEVRLSRLVESLDRVSPGVARVIAVDDGSEHPIELEHLVDQRACESCRGAGGQSGPSRGAGGRSDPSDPSRFSFTLEIIRRPFSGGPAAARNTGAARVLTPLIAFIDVDCIPHDNWLEPLLAQFGDSSVGAAAPRITTDGEWFVHNATIAHYEAAHSPLDMGPEPARVLPLSRVAYVPTATLMVRAESFRLLGGFDESMRFGEDVDFIWRLVGAERVGPVATPEIATAETAAVVDVAKAETATVVRYDPRSRVGHEARPSLGRWIRQRFDYGTSAAPLAARHGDKVSPVVFSRWSALVVVLVLSGHRRLAAGVVVATTFAMKRRLRSVGTGDVVHMVVGGHLGAIAQVGRSALRVWWPLLLVGSLMSRRMRRLAIAAVVLRGVDSRSRTPADVAMAVVDDMSYGAGVWMGCVRARSFAALRPKIT